MQDLGGSNKLKIGLVLGNISEKIKNWEGFPQTSQSHKTLCLIVSNYDNTKNIMTEEQLTNEQLIEKDKVEKLKKDGYFTEVVSNLRKYIETYDLKNTELKIELHTIVQ